MEHVNQQGTTRRAVLRAGAAAGTAAALAAAGAFGARTADAATTAGSGTGGLPYPSGVTDTSHCTPEAGIPLCWIIELEPDPEVTVLSLAEGVYELAAEARAGHVLSVLQPFPVSFDPVTLTELD